MKNQNLLDTWGKIGAVLVIVAGAILAFANAKYTASEALEKCNAEAACFKSHEDKQYQEDRKWAEWRGGIDEQLRAQTRLLDKIDKRLR